VRQTPQDSGRAERAGFDLGESRIQYLLDNSDQALFPKLTDEQLGHLRPIGSVRAVALDEVLFAEGEHSYDPLVVLEGTVAVVQRHGRRVRDIAPHLPRDLVAELNIFTGEPAAASAIVREAGTVLVIPVEEFRALVGRNLEFGDFVSQLLFRRRRALRRLRVGFQIIGPSPNKDTVRLREFAARNRLLREWIDPTEEQARELLGDAAADALATPYVVLGDGEPLRNPTNAELARAAGLLRGSDVSRGQYDLVVVGGGPGGLAAAVYAGSGGMRTVLLDAVAVGGQASTSARIENYLGFPAGLSGVELAERAILQAQKFDVQMIVPCEAVGLDVRDGAHVITLDDGGKLTARAVILAVGIQYRRLPVPGLEAYEGVGVAYATATARQQLRPGDAVVVVGGANSAGQMALALAEEGRQVHLVARGRALAGSMAAYLRERISLEHKIEVHLQTEVRELSGDGHLELVTVEDAGAERRIDIEAGVMVVLIGAMPHTKWLQGIVDLDAEGFILTGPDLGVDAQLREPWAGLGRAPLMLETSRPGVFAVGDARSGSTRMVAPAAGDGGMAVRLAAEHLLWASRRSAPVGV
jgi:thioredoxin reductase (NADPH)